MMDPSSQNLQITIRSHEHRYRKIRIVFDTELSVISEINITANKTLVLTI